MENRVSNKVLKVCILVMGGLFLSSASAWAGGSGSNAPKNYVPERGDYSTLDGEFHRRRNPGKATTLMRTTKTTTTRPIEGETRKLVDPSQATESERILRGVFGGDANRYARAIVGKLNAGQSLSHPQAARGFAAGNRGAIDRAISEQGIDNNTGGARIRRALGIDTAFDRAGALIMTGVLTTTVSVDMRDELRKAGFWIGNNPRRDNVQGLFRLYSDGRINASAWNRYGNASKPWNRQSDRVRNP